MSPQAHATMRRIAAFVRLSRLTFLFGGFAGFALGAAVAATGGARITFVPYAAGQFMVTAFHLMTHYANEYFDRGADVHGEPTEFSGGSGVVVSGELPAGAALSAALVCAAAGVAGIGWFVHAGQPAAACVGAAIGAGAWIYSAPPLRLCARGWGEIDTALVVGVLVPAAGYTAFTGRIGAPLLAAIVAPAAAMFAMMLAVEWPDRRADATAGKRNLVVRGGPAGAARLIRYSVVPIVPAVIAALSRESIWAGLAFGALLLPPLLAFVRRLAVPGCPAVEIAARGVALFALTVAYQLFGYVAVLRLR